MSPRLALACAACALAACQPATTLSGAVQSTGAALGDWLLAPTRCTAGDNAEFNGVDLSDGRHNLRVDDDPLKGYVVAVAPSGDPGAPRAWLSPTSGCASFAATVAADDDGWDGSGGSLILDCALDAGGAIAGRIAWDHCYAPETY